jgi:hypothetical protein
MANYGITIRFKITIENHDLGSGGKVEGYPLGLKIENHEAVRQLASLSGFEVVSHSKPSNREYVGIEVYEPHNSSRLAKLLQILEERYGFKPWPHAVFDMRQRDRFFGVERIRTFSKKEIDQCEYLAFGLVYSLGHAVFRTEEQFAADQYITDKVANLKKDPAMGCLSPFQALVVMPQMRDILLKANLVGLDVDEEVIGSKGRLFKLGSSIILPKTLTRIVNGQGEDVDPDVWKVTTIHGGTEDHIYDDGHRPCILRYRRAEFEQHAPFDVAMTYEFIGNHKQGAYRGLIVSQKFRQLLRSLQVRGTYFSPILLE